MSKGRPRKFDVEQAIETSMLLFWEHGYEGTSIAMLSQAIGINVPSLYSAFGSKQDLFLKVLERYSLKHRSVYLEALKKKTAREVAYALLHAEVELATQATMPKGCLIIHSALATSPEAEPLHMMLCATRNTSERWIEERFQRAINERDLPASIQAAALAHYIMVVSAGVAVQAKNGALKEKLLQTIELALAVFPTSQSTTMTITTHPQHTHEYA